MEKMNLQLFAGEMNTQTTGALSAEMKTYYGMELLENAKPLMEIYRANGASRLNAFLLADSRTPGRRRCVLSAPPLYTADPAFLAAVLQRHDVPVPDQERNGGIALILK